MRWMGGSLKDGCYGGESDRRREQKVGRGRAGLEVGGQGTGDKDDMDADRTFASFRTNLMPLPGYEGPEHT